MTFRELIQSEKPVLVDFSAEWCGPCRMQAPILYDLKKKMKEEVRILKIDIDQNRKLANTLGIRSVPTLMIFKDGEPKWRNSGVFPAERLEELIKQFS